MSGYRKCPVWQNSALPASGSTTVCTSRQSSVLTKSSTEYSHVPRTDEYTM